jgi:hypothetical protein
MIKSYGSPLQICVHPWRAERDDARELLMCLIDSTVQGHDL